MAAIITQLEVIRGERAPATPYDPRQVRIEQRRRTRAQEKVHEKAPEKAREKAEYEKGHGK